MDKIDMSLDDIIKSNRGQNRKSQHGNRGDDNVSKGSQSQRARRVQKSPRKPVGVVLKGHVSVGIQKAKFSKGDVNNAWKHNMYDGPKRTTLKRSDSAKLLVSNLDYGVSDSDIRELFTEFGPLKKAAVHYDRAAKSLGSADVVFERRSDAIKAIKQYNGIPLDGRPMNIQFLTDASSLTRPVSSRGITQKRAPQLAVNQRSAGGGKFRAGPANRNRISATATARNTRKPATTSEELDAELDAYVNDIKI